MYKVKQKIDLIKIKIIIIIKNLDKIIIETTIKITTLQIRIDLINSGVLEENIHSLGLCTNCEKEIKLHSYRKSNGAYGRLFSFVYIKE